jgi:hypothetical protein
MTVAGILNLLAWLLSALIAGWLIFDMVRVSRRYDEEHLLAIPETFDALPADEKDLR